MPVATTSVYANGNPRGRFARQLWSDFRLYAMKARHGMQDRRNMALKDAQREWLSGPPGRSQQLQEQQRAEISKLHETQYYLEMREEWQRILHNNGLQHEDWGEVTAQEMSVIRSILGPDELEAEEESHRSGNGGESQHNPPRNHDFVPAPVAAQPLSQSVSHQSQSSITSHSSLSSYNTSYGAPSLSSRSQNTSSASYARIDPRYFTDDEQDGYPNPFSGRRGPGFPVGSDDEDGGIPVPSYKSWAHSDQQHTSAYPTHHNSSNQSSLSSSPADAPMSRSYHQPSSSLSSSSNFPPHVPSSLSKSVSAEAEDDADRIFTRATNGASSSSAAAAAAAAAKPKSKLRSGYIGPQLTTNDSENEADADFASMSKADQIAAYENFKWETRIQKIREFHDEAAKLDIELAEKINGGSNGHGDGHTGYDKAGVAQMIAKHEQDMLMLRARKEEERKKLVDNERARMKTEINKGRAGASGTTTQKKGRAVSSTAKGVPKSGVSSSTNPMLSSFNTASNRTPVVPAAKPKTPARSSPAAGLGAMNLDGLQSVFDSAPGVGLDTAFQISQLLQSGEDGDDSGHDPSHDQNWSTPQLNHAHSSYFPNTSSAGTRTRTDSISVLDESKFGTISAKSAKQRRGTITVSTAAAANDPNSGFWKPQAQPPSPEESQALTDQYAKLFLGEGPANRTSASRAAVRQDEDEDDWVGWGSKPTSKAGKANMTNTGATSAWTAKKPAQASPAPPGSSSPSMAASSGWGASVKKTFGFGGNNVGGGWGEWGQESRSSEDFEQIEQGEEGEEEEEIVHPSPFSVHKKPSLLSDMMAKGKNVVAGAVGVALGPMGVNPSSPSIPAQPLGGSARRNSAAAAAPPPAPPPTATAAGKKAAKKGRQAANKKTTIGSLTNQEEEETQEPETQSHLTTPRAASSSTKFTSGFGSANNNTSANTFSFGSPTSRNAASSGGGWEDTMSTTPRPGGMSGVFGGNMTGPGSMRRPSGLHHQVWNADEEEEEEEEEQEEEEEEEETGENEWNMPGSLNPRGAFGARASASKSGWGMSANTTATKTAGKAATNASAWGRGSMTTSAANAAASAANSKKGSRLATKPHVTMEEIPDESDEPWNRSPSDFLASDSRVIMEPKPSKPSAVYEEIIQFGAEGSSPEDARQPSMVPNKRGALGRGTTGGQVEEIYDQEWFQKAAMQLQQGTAQGNRIFGDQFAGGMKSVPPTNSGINIPGRGGPSGSNGQGPKAWAQWSSAPPSNMTGPASGSFRDSSPLANGPPPKMSSGFGNASLNQAWGAGASSSPKVGVGIGVGKNLNPKAKPTTGTSTGFGMGGGFGWGSTSASVFGNAASNGENDGWGQELGNEGDVWAEQKTEEEQEREEELLKSRKRLQDMFNGSNPGSSAKPGTKATAGGPAARAKALREQKEREEREREEREAQEREAKEKEEREAREKEAQEKAAKEAKEKEAAAAKTAASKAGGGKKGKGKKR